VAAFKYQSRLVNGRVLAAGISTYLQQQYHADMLPALLVPVPLHGRRVRQRGFNQSLELARWLSQQLAIPVANNLVARSRHTPQQTGLSAAERKRNLRGAFRVRQGFRFVPGTTVAIVDDVVTTGTTVTALAKVLLRAGAEEVHVWAIARTSL
jgi:ComF family protein